MKNIFLTGFETLLDLYSVDTYTRMEEEEFLANRENPSVGGTTWERIAKLVDLSDKGAKGGKSDKTRFRELLQSLKKDENAPGAKVVVE